MLTAPIPVDEQERLAAVHRMGLLDTEPETRFDALTLEATRRLRAPISTISILDERREWFKSCQGLPSTEGPRAISFCAHALLAQDMFVIENAAKDERFKDNPMVTGAPHIRAYAGIALMDYQSGKPIGVFCIKDTKPRAFSVEELGVLAEIAHRAEVMLNEAAMH